MNLHGLDRAISDIVAQRADIVPSRACSIRPIIDKSRHFSSLTSGGRRPPFNGANMTATQALFLRVR